MSLDLDSGTLEVLDQGGAAAAHSVAGDLAADGWGAQADAIRASAGAKQQQRGTIPLWEMGRGKSQVAAADAYLAGCQRVLVFCPPHLVKKWRSEIKQTAARPSCITMPPVMVIFRALLFRLTLTPRLVELWN